MRDIALQGYVRSVTQRLIGPQISDLRIYLVRDPDFNASMFPNGMMLVHTGLLARTRSEAQLAAVLGHECGHYLAAAATGFEANAGAAYDDRKAQWLEAIADTRPVLIEEQVKLNDPGASLYLVNNLAQDGWNGMLRYYEGEVYRLRGEPSDAALAAAAYAAAVDYPEAPPEAHRAHGYAQIKAGNVEEGRRALARYLELNPTATDAEMVRFTLGL